MAIQCRGGILDFKFGISDLRRGKMAGRSRKCVGLALVGGVGHNGTVPLAMSRMGSLPVPGMVAPLWQAVLPPLNLV